jgi:hypothetical protein
MASLTLRVSKGSPLTFAEVDGNFSALNNELAEKAPLASPALTGDPTAPTPATSDNDTSIATTAFVKAQAYAPLASPALTGDPTAPTPATSDNDTSIATTAFVKAQAYAPLASPALTGTPTAPTAATSTNTTQLATTAFVKAQPFAPLASPALTGTPTAPTAATATNTTQLATTAFVQAAVVQSGPLAGFRNAIINGNFDVWQRGTSFALDTSYLFLADRWRAGHGSGSGKVGSSSRQAFALGQTEVPGEPTYFLRHEVTTAGSGYTDGPYLFQAIEGVRTFAGQQVTVSFWAKRGSTSYAISSILLEQRFGDAGSPSPRVDTTVASNVVVTTSWQKFVYTVTLPSISGKTMGTDGKDSLTLSFVFPSNAVYRLDIAQVQIEPGPVATPFERRPIGTELALCQRYYCKSYNLGTAPGTATTVGAFWQVSSDAFAVRFPVRMRAEPTLTGYSTQTGAAGKVRRDSGTLGDVDFEPFNQFETGFTAFANVGGSYWIFQYTASAEL